MPSSRSRHRRGRDRYLSLRELPPFLARHGYPIGFSTLRKLCLPSRGQGPPIAASWGSMYLFEPEATLKWADERLHRAR